MTTLNLPDSDMKALIKILDNALANPDLFTDVDDDGYEKFNRDFFATINNLKKVFENSNG
jgi:hypothetical protein